MHTKEFLIELNTAYKRLDEKAVEIANAVFHRMFAIECGWYNGSHYKREDGRWCEVSFPIPIITIKGLCNIEIRFDRIIVFTKQSREDVLNYSFDKFLGYEFEAYGAEDYYSEFFCIGSTIEKMKETVRKSRQKEVEFWFGFPFDTNETAFFEFAKLIKREGFYY